ncbi:hypothetical protein [Streptomyces virginiae]|uniref:hypothetical protein n=1 Tax=Streptomyces virginiae TaxID=1961 RepID=UPI002250D34C|nr:hypothetical protein [Streptomyces virginiae]MCX4720339.1 hypothetical protein [Streptomyces virginiae]MCX5270739.1 hypothetical protein [Streptomyces virginiae]
MGTMPRTARYAAHTLLAALALTGCSSSAPPSAAGSASPSADPADPATTAPPSPVQVCTSLVSYWAKETLLGTTWSGLDWEQKGLSNAQYAIHEGAVAAGRAEERTAGRDKALELIDRFVAQRCAAEGGATTSSENWRPPT